MLRVTLNEVKGLYLDQKFPLREEGFFVARGATQSDMPQLKRKPRQASAGKRQHHDADINHRNGLVP